MTFPEVGRSHLGDPAIPTRAALGDEAFAEAAAIGRAMDLEQMVELLSRISVSD